MIKNDLTTATVVKMQAVVYTLVTTGICINSILNCWAISKVFSQCSVIVGQDEQRKWRVPFTLGHGVGRWVEWTFCLRIWIMASSSVAVENESGEPSRENSSDEGENAHGCIAWAAWGSWFVRWRELGEFHLAEGLLDFFRRYGGCQRARDGEDGDGGQRLQRVSRKRLLSF